MHRTSPAELGVAALSVLAAGCSGGAVHSVAWPHPTATAIELLHGSAAAALQRLEPWLTNDTDARPHDGMMWCTAAEACLELGDTARGDELADHAVRRAELAHNDTDGIDALRIKARSVAGLGRTAEARALLDRAAARASDIPYPAAATRVATDLARL